MREVTREAYAKINLGLDVVGRRSDGYHLVRMVMQTIGISDTLVFTDLGESAQKDAPVIRLQLAGQQNLVPADEDNLVCRAIRCMENKYAIGHDIAVSLDKRIPVAAGMAGGSTDAAAAFCAVRDLFVPGVSDGELEQLALPLGADIPYCIMGGTALAEGIGEKLTALAPAPDCALVIVKPQAAVPTGGIYRAYDALDNQWHPDIDGQLRAIREGNLRQLAALCGNVLELVTGAQNPVIGATEKFFLERGALAAKMTGSGPTVFAIYEDREGAEKALEQFEEDGPGKGCRCFVTGFTNKNK